MQQQAAGLRYTVLPFPRNADNPASAGVTPATGGWLLAIPQAARDHEAAWEWLKHATLSQAACDFTARQGRPSPLTGCDADAGLASSQPFWSVVTASQRGASGRQP